MFSLLCGRQISNLQSELSLLKQQHRAEIFALEQNLRTTESERDALKLQISMIEADHALTKKKLQETEAKLQQCQDANERQARMIQDFRNPPSDGILPSESCL